MDKRKGDMGKKSVAILRHGEAMPANPMLGDHGRVLSSRGQQQASGQGRRWLKSEAPLDFIVCSDATRTLQTASLFAQAHGCTGRVTATPSLYNAEMESYLEVLMGLPAHVHHVLVVAHMPGVWEAGAWLVQNQHFVVGSHGYPPGAMAKFALHCKDWHAIAMGCAKLQAFLLP